MISSRRDVVEHEGGQGVAILFELHGDAAGRRVAIVGDRDIHPHFDAGRAHARLGHERRDGQIRPRLAHAADQVNLGDVSFPSGRRAACGFRSRWRIGECENRSRDRR